MEAKEALKDVDLKVCKAVIEDFLDKYMNPAFGVLPKREIDLLILEMLQNLGCINPDPSIYSLVQQLRVTRSKARNLIYDRELRRYDVEELDKKLRDAIKSPLIQKQGDLFKIEIENPLVADHLRSRLQSLGHTTDASFSSSLVTLSTDAFAALIESCLPDEAREKVKRALIKAGAPDDSLKGVVKGVLIKLGTKFADKAGGALAGQVGDYLEPLVEGSVQKSAEVFRELLR